MESLNILKSGYIEKINIEIIINYLILKAIQQSFNEKERIIQIEANIFSNQNFFIKIKILI